MSYHWCRLSDKKLDLTAFNCMNNDLTDFLINDSINYQNQLLAVSYLLINSDAKVIAFYSVSNDRISLSTLNRNKKKKVLKSIPHLKRGYNHFPAVKIGRLGVHKDFQKAGLGSKILDYIKFSFIEKNKTGCRFITVDAYNNEKVINFYKKNGFIEFPYKKEDKKCDTLLLYFDLLPVQNLNIKK